MAEMPDPVHWYDTGIVQVHVPGQTLPPYNGTECYWVGEPNGPVWLVDTGDGQESAVLALESSWRSLGKPEVEGILLTHWHEDHTGGRAWALDTLRAPVYMSAADREVLRARHPGQDGIQVIEPGAVTVGSLQFDILAAPGHTAGQLNVWIPGRRMLLAGDNVLGSTTSVVVPPDGNLRQYLHTLHALRSLSPRWIGPGHGPLISAPVEYLTYYIRHRADREAEILERLRQAGPLTSAQLAEAIYRDQGAAAIGAGRYMLLGHLEALTDEGRVVQDPDGRYQVC